MTDDKTPRAGGLTPALIYAHDLAWAAAVMMAVVAGRYYFELKATPVDIVVRATALFTAICAVVFPLFRLHRGLWRFTALNDIIRVGQAVVAAMLVLTPILFVIDRGEDFPRSALLVTAPVLTACLSFGRVLAHAAARGDLRAAFQFQDRSRPPAVVVGSAEAVAAYLTDLRRDPSRNVRVVGIVALENGGRGRMIQGAEILGGLPQLTGVLKSLHQDGAGQPLVVLAERRPGRDLYDAVVAAAGEANARVVRVRSGERTNAAIAPIGAADLLDRPPRTLDIERARQLIAGKRVLVTGAGGTIGAELSRQALPLGPERLILLDSSEFNLYAIDEALREEGFPRVWTAELGDVRDRARMEALFAREKPHVVLHAAALKHVPLMELNPCEAVQTNVGGAMNIATLARDVCEAVVFISTDKAVNPTNVMGATKRVAERCVQALTHGRSARSAIVRFGNVLGSTGSVTPIFERQIARGGPVTVTHPDMVRYFMTVQEAAALVLQAAALPAAAEAPEAAQVFVLDMGEPVRIDHLARQLIGLHGLRPDVDIKIVYSGVRPGEKLYEDVFYEDEAVRPTAADGVMAAFDPAPDWEALGPAVRDLLAAAAAQDEALMFSRLQALEPAFQRG
jgi:O-antigen biosynthesis protein WbqV